MPKTEYPTPGGDGNHIKRTENNNIVNTSAIGGSLLPSDVASLKDLVPSEIPKIGSFLDVHVTLAANPGNFTVQSWTKLKALEELQDEMMAFYSKPENRKPLTISDLSRDCYFAALYGDNAWYRVRVNSQIDTTTVAARLVDYGDCTMVSVSDMQILWSQFRNLPVQAINASLHGKMPPLTKSRDQSGLNSC